ncbi:MAG: class I SAM-dependent methyltransferase [Candidatus Thorarchaeota archaeon]|nr:class I SAM-dependent methyltransferase [Candidatus Thorarchaeota archaeon]
MEHVWPSHMYRFLKIIETIPLEKKILDCGAGGPRPPLALFCQYGYETHGIDISESAISSALKFSEENQLNIDIIEGDIRKIPFDDESFSFVFTQHSICHLTKKDTKKAIVEITRVLRPGGYCFVDFMSTSSSYYGAESLGKEVSPGEYQYVDEDDNTVLHCFHSDGEPDQYFSGLRIVRKIKTIVENPNSPTPDIDVRMEYYATKAA